MNKKILILFILVAAVGLLSFVATRKRGFQAPPPTSRSSVLPPVFPSPTGIEQPAYAVPSLDVKMLSSVTLVSYKRPLDIPSFSKSLASRLGFSGNPTVSQGKTGTFYSWIKGVKSLSVGGDPLSVDFNTGGASIETLKITPAQADAKARAYVLSLKLLPLPLHALPPLFFSPISASASIPSDDPKKATTIELPYQYVIDSLPVFAIRPDAPSVAVRLDSSGGVLSFSATLLGEFQKTSTVVSPISSTDAVGRLKEHKGVLIDVASPYAPGEESPPPVSVPTATIRSIDFGYYYTPGQSLLTPVFVFRGAGPNQYSETTAETTTILSALP